MRSNGFEKVVTTRPWAIAGWNGTTNLIYSDRVGGVMNSINATFCQKNKLDPQQQIEVLCYTLPQIIEDSDIDKVRLCKIDCEGAELEILKKVTEKELQKVDSFVLEYHPEAYEVQELVKLMLGWGTHQISFADNVGAVLRIAGQDACGFGERPLIRAVSNRVLGKEIT